MTQQRDVWRLAGAARKAFALPLTLFLLVMIALLVTGLLTTVTLEHKLAENRLRKLQARALAESGLEAGLQLIREGMLGNPAHAVGYLPEHESLQATLDSPENAVRPAMLVVNLDTGESEEVELRSVADFGDADAWVDLNESLAHGIKFDEIPKMPAGWIEMPVEAGSAAERAGLRLRFAFFIDDETSRLNYATTGNAEGPNGEFVRRPRGIATNLDPGVLPWFGSSGWAEQDGTINREFLTFRQHSPFLEPAFVNRFDGFESAPYPLLVGFSGTALGLGNQLSSSGHQRANLHALLKLNEGDSAEVQAALATWREVLERRLPRFAARYRPGETAVQTDSEHRRRYLDQLGIQIIDQLDPDQVPTILGDPENLLTFPVQDRQEPIHAVGEESIPMLLGHAWWFRLEPSVPNEDKLPFEGTVDHFFEFLNLGTKPFTAPEGMELAVRNRPDLDGGAGPIAMPDFTIPLGGIEFPAGTATIVGTADLPPNLVPRLIDENANLVVVEIGESARAIKGIMNEIDESKSDRRSSEFQLRLARNGSQMDQDFATFVEWGANQQVYGYFPFLDLQQITEQDRREPFSLRFDSDSLEALSSFRGSRLDGRNPPLLTGDPRGLLSQVSFLMPPNRASRSVEMAESMQTPFMPMPLLMGRNKDSNQKLGTLLTDHWRRDRWPDDGDRFDGTPASAPGVVLDRLMQNVGEFRFVFDPRLAELENWEHQRPGGRSLRIGRPESLATGERFSPSWQMASWRLTDAFDVDLPMTERILPSSNSVLNVNGVLRDGGVALRAALRGLILETDPVVAGQRLGHQISATEEDQIIAALQDHIRRHGLFLERGEISEIDLNDFHTGNASAGSEINDRTREEWLSRLIPLITTRSFSYRISAIGQVYRQRSNGEVEVLGESSVVAIYQLRPKFEEGEDPVVEDYEAACIYRFPAE